MHNQMLKGKRDMYRAREAKRGDSNIHNIRNMELESINSKQCFQRSPLYLRMD